MKKIVEANGAYVEDSEGLGNGIRDISRVESFQNTVNATVMTKFFERVDAMKEGNGALFILLQQNWLK